MLFHVFRKGIGKPVFYYHDISMVNVLRVSSITYSKRLFRILDREYLYDMEIMTDSSMIIYRRYKTMEDM